MFVDILKDELNYSETENGAVGYKTTGSKLVDFNFNIASYRSKSKNKIQTDFKAVWNENKEYALKYLFYIRDVREGIGERDLFRTCILEIVDELDTRVFDWIAEFGRYDDLFVFFDTKLESEMIEFVRTQLNKDLDNMDLNKSISLLSKWMPSINTSSQETRKLARRFVEAFNVTNHDYRKALSKLRNYIDVVERKCCANRWSEIKYEAVPSLANIKYRNAFKKHDTERRLEYLNRAKEGKAKFNASVTFPHTVVNQYGYAQRIDDTLELAWKNLTDYAKGDNSNILVVRDGSGSMTCTIGDTSISALDVSTALAIYFAQRLNNQFKNTFITFSARPEIVSFNGYETLRDILRLCYDYTDCSNTNIEAVFDLVLKIAVKYKLPQREIPNLLIISDMEFDGACYPRTPNERLFKVLSDKYAEYGYVLPRLIFWNVNSRTNTIPLTENGNGVILVSGFSPAIINMVLSGEIDPYKAILSVILSERYSKITLQ